MPYKGNGARVHWTLQELASFCERNDCYVEIDGDRMHGYLHNQDGSTGGVTFILDRV
jgi:hypothetical protein